MFHQERLIDKVNADLSAEFGIKKPYWQKYACLLSLEDIFTTDTVYICSQRCAAGMADRKDTQRWQENPWLNSYRLCQAVLNGTFIARFYPKHNIIERGHIRLIEPPTFECKVVQKVICDYVLKPLLTTKMVSTNYASVKGRGTDQAYADVLDGLNKALALYPNGVVVQTDYHDYFASISNDILEANLSYLIADKRLVKLIRAFCPQPFGQSLGSEVAQVPASWYPSPIDHDIKDRYGVKFAYRFMDDGLYILPNEDEAKRFIAWFTKRSAELHLTVNPAKTKITPLGQEIRFCKQRYYFSEQTHSYYFVPNPKMASTEIRKLKAMKKKLDAKELTPEYIQCQFGSVIGRVRSMPNSMKFVRKMGDAYKELFGEEVQYEKGKKKSVKLRGRADTVARIDINIKRVEVIPLLFA